MNVINISPTAYVHQEEVKRFYSANLCNGIVFLETFSHVSPRPILDNYDTFWIVEYKACLINTLIKVFHLPIPKSWGLPTPNPVLHDHKRYLIDIELVVNINANLVPRFFPSGWKRANQISCLTNYVFTENIQSVPRLWRK